MQNKILKHVRNGIIISLILIFCLPYLQREALVLENISNYKLSNRTKENLNTVYLYIGPDGQSIEPERIRERFNVCDSIFLLDTLMNQKQRIQIVDFAAPYITYELHLWGPYAYSENFIAAGEETLISEIHFIWLPWGWLKISEVWGMA